MDANILQDKMQAFAQRLLQEAHGDPVRALGLLVLILDGADIESAEHAQRLVAKVRQVLMPEGPVEMKRPVQHLAGEVSLGRSATLSSLRDGLGSQLSWARVLVCSVVCL